MSAAKRSRGKEGFLRQGPGPTALAPEVEIMHPGLLTFPVVEDKIDCVRNTSNPRILDLSQSTGILHTLCYDYGMESAAPLVRMNTALALLRFR